jgi:DNA-binding transcriptional regulator YdaS (Cro superfamily)
MNHPAFAAFIDHYGTSHLAEDLGVSKSLVSSWRHGRFRVAAKHCLRIEALSKGQVTAAMLQPEVFGPATADAMARVA